MARMRRTNPIASAIAPSEIADCCHNRMDRRRNSYQQHGVDDLKADNQNRDQAHLALHSGHEPVHGFMGVNFLATGMRKEFDRLDIGVAVDDATGHLGPRIRLYSGNLAQTRHEMRRMTT